jgi:regulation of enolase protein 1 (concanavalin A-like superfamily)
MDNTFHLPGLPGELTWKNHPEEFRLGAEDSLFVRAGAETDWFVDPAGGYAKDNAPAALFIPSDKDFTLSTHVRVEFASTFDAGVLQLRAGEGLWGKLCFEYSPQGQPMVVSVVTREVSDDCNGVPVAGNEVFLRLLRRGQTFAFHYSTDGKYWHFVRYFSLGPIVMVQAGFSAQSPTGPACNVTFAQITYRAGAIEDLRSGE